ncbi:hypothetical protein KTF37_30540 [Burkholderia multivorans]|uniref:hypothetical protein n=1 Tax=Burkholderia multivorans TaxID=87883 RepID=UPI001C21E1F4|nr:hypothetical protein [Burkholderia multivorans]MBU9681188.1 hypothetical protein [Burkholderia multivorans]
MANAILPGCDARPIEIIRTELINEQAAYWARRQPAPLFAGSGFSDEALKQTTLTRYLDFDTWTPAAAAMLVCGLQAPIENGQLCTEIPAGRVKGLDGLWKSEQNCTAIADAKRVLGIWRSQVNPSARVRPLDFVEWCQARGFDIAWLRSIEDDVLSKERGAMKAALGSGVVVVPSANHFAVWLADHIAFSLVAIPNDERLTTVFKVTAARQEPGSTQSKYELLTSDEWRLVRSICGNPPAPCSRAQFEEWRGKFNAAGNKPDWSLDGDFCWSDETVKAQARWTDVSQAHRQQFEQMAKKGDLSLVTPDGTPTTDISKGRMSRDDFIRYLQSRGLRMQGAVAVSVAPAVGAQTDVVVPATAGPSTPEPDRPEQAIPIESLFTQPGFERNYQMLVTEPGSSPIKSAITSALIASAKAGETLAASIRTIKKKGEKWSDAELRTLLDESKMPDFTQKAAGEKYGVKPQRISRLLQQAKDKFEASVKASKFPTANLSGRKVRGRNY